MPCPSKESRRSDKIVLRDRTPPLHMEMGRRKSSTLRSHQMAMFEADFRTRPTDEQSALSSSSNDQSGASLPSQTETMSDCTEHHRCSHTGAAYSNNLRRGLTGRRRGLSSRVDVQPSDVCRRNTLCRARGKHGHSRFACAACWRRAVICALVRCTQLARDRLTRPQTHPSRRHDPTAS